MATDSLQPIYDADTLAQLQDLIDEGDTSFLDELFVSYLETAAENIQVLRTDDDQDTLRRAAHTLKGSSLNVGAAQVAGVCKRLESDLVTTALIEDLPDRLRTLEAQLELVRTSYPDKLKEMAANLS